MARFEARASLATIVALSFGPLWVEIAGADFRPDLVVATSSQQIGIYCKGDGGGGFACSSLQEGTETGAAVAAGDVNGDHQVDLVFGNTFAESTGCLATAPDTFLCGTVDATPSLTRGVALDFVDNDFVFDIVYANANEERDRLCRWSGMVFICTDVSTDQISSLDVALGDLNEDGRTDAAFATVSAAVNSRVCLGNGLGAFTCSDIAGTERVSTGVALADLDQNVVLDIVLANTEAPSQVCEGSLNGDYACSDIEPIERHYSAVVIGEFNGDDDPDLVFTNRDDDPEFGGPSRVCFGGVGLSFSCSDLSDAPANTFGAAVADWNRDGADDVALANVGSPSRICFGHDDGTFSCTDIDGNTHEARGIAAIIPPPIYAAEGEIDVSPETGFKSAPAVTSAARRGSVIVWHEASESDTESEIFARRYDLDGDAAGAVIPVDDRTKGEQSTPDVAMASDGSFVVAWTFNDTSAQHADIDGSGVAARRFSADGAPLGGEFQVPSFSTGDQARPRVAIAPDRSFIVTWESRDVVGMLGGARQPDGSGLSVQARIFDASGTPIGDEFIVNQTTEGEQRNPSVAARPDGSFVVAWVSGGSPENEVYARVVLADGSMPGDEFVVNEPTETTHDLPDVAAATDGRFVVVWHSPREPLGALAVRARVFTAAATPLSRELRVTELEQNTRERPRVAFGAGRRFVVSWTSLGDVRAQQFEPTGKKVEPELRVVENADELDTMLVQDVTGAPDGHFVFTWSESRLLDPTVTRVERRHFTDPNVEALGGTTTTTATTTTTSTTTTTLDSGSTTTTTSSVTTTTLPVEACGDPVALVAPVQSLGKPAPTVAGVVTATDALYTLSAAVGLVSCDVCVCDVDTSGLVTAVDALRMLQFAVGIEVSLTCPACAGL